MTKTKPLAEHGQGHTEAGRGAAPNDHPLTVGLRSGVGQFLLRHPSLSRRLAAPIEEEYVVGLDLHPGSIRSSLLLCGYSVRWPVQELDLPGDDLGAVVLDALVLFVVPATRLEPPLDVDEGAFLEVLIAEFRKALPYYNAMSKILILSSALDDERVLAAVRAGADGTSSGPARAGSGRAPGAGGSPARGRPTREPERPRACGLRSARAWVKQRRDRRGAARGRATVRTHVASMLDKLGLRNRTQIILYALKRGVIRIENLL